MRYVGRWLAAAACFALCGCAIATNHLSPDKATPPVGAEGAVVISTGAPDFCTNAVSFFKIAHVGDKYRDSLGWIEVNNGFIKSDFPDHQGFVNAFDLPAGDYELRPGVGNVLLKLVRVPRWRFTVKAGEGVYLGEFFMDRSCSWAGSYDHGVFRDRSDRDIAFVRQMSPALANITFKTRLARFDGYLPVELDDQ